MITFRWAGQGRPRSPATGPGPITTTFGDDNNGAETTRTLGNGVVQTTTRDNSGRPTRIKAVNASGTVISDLSYSYTAAAAGPSRSTDRTLVQSRTNTLGVGGPAGSVTSYGYDTLNRLTSAVEKTSGGAVNASWGYTYDAAGNRLSATTAGATVPANTPSTGSVTTSWGYNDANGSISRNASTTGYSFDPAGNQTGSADWGTAVYDQGRSAVKSVTPTGASTATAVTVLGLGNTTRTGLGSATFTNGSLGLATSSVSGTSYRRLPDGELISARTSAGARGYFLHDILGSVVAITNPSGNTTAAYSYDPYGATRTATENGAASNPIRYIGGYLDTTTGLYQLGARYYDPTTSRFTQQDPTGQEANPYAYARNCPSTLNDPAGASARCATGAVAGAFAGGLEGAAIGSVIPGVGTAIGAAVGGVIGAGVVSGFVAGACASSSKSVGGRVRSGAYGAGVGALVGVAGAGGQALGTIAEG